MAWGDAKKAQWDMAFLLIVLSITTEHERILASSQYGCIHAKPTTQLWQRSNASSWCLWMAVPTGCMPSSNWMRSCHMHPCPAWATLVPWQMVTLPQTLAVDSTSSRCVSCYSVRTWWYVQKTLTARWKPCSLPSKSFPFGMLLPPANPPMNCNWWQWTSAACRLRAQQPLFRLSLLHQSYPFQQTLLSLLGSSLQLTGTMEQLQQASPITSASVSQHSMPRKQPPSAALGSPPAAEESEYPFSPEGMDSITSVPLATLMPTILTMVQTSMQVPIPASALSFTHVTL